MQWTHFPVGVKPSVQLRDIEGILLCVTRSTADLVSLAALPSDDNSDEWTVSGKCGAVALIVAEGSASISAEWAGRYRYLGKW